MNPSTFQRIQHPQDSTWKHQGQGPQSQPRQASSTITNAHTSTVLVHT